MTITQLQVDTLLSPQRKAFLPPLQVYPYPDPIVHVLENVCMLNFGGMSAMPLLPTPTSSCCFHEILLSEIEFCC